MVWIPLGVLIGGIVLALLVFGFGAYEINWKQARLRTDLARLETLSGRLGRLQAEMARAEARLAAAQRLLAERRGN